MRPERTETMRPYASIFFGFLITPVILTVCCMLWATAHLLSWFSFYDAEIALLNGVDQVLEAGLILLKPAKYL